MRSWDLIVFDMDGVLVDTSPCHAESFALLWRDCAVTGPPYHQIAGRPTREVVAQYTASLNPTPEQVEQWVAFKQTHARTLLASRPILYPDTRGALERLRSRATPLALATAASRETMQLILARSELLSFFPVAVSADDVTFGKPAPDLYQRAISRAGATAERCLVVEDSAAGIAAGLAAGAEVACVRTGLVVEEPRFAGAFPDLAALVDFLEHPIEAESSFRVRS